MILNYGSLSFWDRSIVCCYWLNSNANAIALEQVFLVLVNMIAFDHYARCVAPKIHCGIARSFNMFDINEEQHVLYRRASTCLIYMRSNMFYIDERQHV